MTCAVVLLLILPTACNPLDRLFQKQDTDPESCDVTWLLRNASGRELWFEFADFGFHWGAAPRLSSTPAKHPAWQKTSIVFHGAR